MQHLDKQLGVWISKSDRAALSPCGHGLERCFTNLLLMFGTQPAGVVVAQTCLAPRPIRLFEPMHLAGELHQDHQQGRNVGDVNSLGIELFFFGSHRGVRRSEHPTKVQPGATSLLTPLSPHL